MTPLHLTSVHPSSSTVVIVAEAFSPEDNVVYLVKREQRDTPNTCRHVPSIYGAVEQFISSIVLCILWIFDKKKLIAA